MSLRLVGRPMMVGRLFMPQGTRISILKSYQSHTIFRFRSQRSHRLFLARGFPEWMGYYVCHLIDDPSTSLICSTITCRLLQDAIDDCNNPNDDTGAGVVSACPFFTMIQPDTAMMCQITPVVNEVVNGTLTKLAG